MDDHQAEYAQKVMNQAFPVIRQFLFYYKVPSNPKIINGVFIPYIIRGTLLHEVANTSFMILLLINHLAVGDNEAWYLGFSG